MGSCPSCSGATVCANAPDAYRFGDISQRPRTHIVEIKTDFGPDLPASIVGNANTPGFRDPFKTNRYIDRVTIDIMLFNDDITDVNTDTKFDPFVLGHIDILLGHAALDFVGTAQGVDHAGELDKSAVARVLDNASAKIGDFGIEKDLSESLQLLHRPFFVNPYQTARARDIRRQNCRQSPL